MLTRPGSEPGPEWMRRLGGNPRQLRKAILSIIVFVGVIQLAAIVVGDIAVYRADGRHVRLYNSPIQMIVGGLTLGAGAVGWRAIGAVAVGQAALGSLVIGRWAYAGPGVALGRDESSGGKQKESLIG